MDIKNIEQVRKLIKELRQIKRVREDIEKGCYLRTSMGSGNENVLASDEMLHAVSREIDKRMQVINKELEKL